MSNGYETVKLVHKIISRLHRSDGHTIQASQVHGHQRCQIIDQGR